MEFILESWGEMLEYAFKDNGDDFSKIITTLTERELNEKFDSGYGDGETEGVSFTAWGENWVYFPIRYDGSESVGSAPRNPCNTKLGHQGGEQ